MKHLTRVILFLSSFCLIASEFNFLVIGDWGGSDHAPYYTAAQKRNVNGMGRVSEEIGAQIVVSLGDNFYNTGVSDEDVELRYKHTFEEVYNHSALVELPWYALAGNHDYYGNVEAQMTLSQRYPRWKFPSLFHEYSFNWSETEVDSVVVDSESPPVAQTYSIQIIMIDTVVLAGLVDRVDIPFMQPPGPRDHEVAQKWYGWLEEKLNQSTADYIWVAGHYPVYSVCWQGSSMEMIRNVQPLLNHYGAHYMAGHDHCQLHLLDNSTGVNYLLTGMGHSCCYGERNDISQPGSLATPEEKLALLDARAKLKYHLSAHHNPTNAAAGFASIQTDSRRMKVSIHDQDGEVLYTSDDILPRLKK